MGRSTQVTNTAADVMKFLEEHGQPQAKPMLMRHGARDPFFGTRLGDMKPLAKKIGKDHALALELYATGNSDAMYLAGLIADEEQMSKSDLRRWVKDAYWYMLSESTCASLAAESRFGFELAREWIDSPKEMIAAAGWATWSSLLTIRPNEEFDRDELDGLLRRVVSTIHGEQNRVRYAMNQFVICLGAYLPEYTAQAKAAGERIGKVDVDMGGTECKVPLIVPYIEKIEARGAIGRKKNRSGRIRWADCGRRTTAVGCRPLWGGPERVAEEVALGGGARSLVDPADSPGRIRADCRRPRVRLPPCDA